jgi:hypothetical protein
MGYSQHRGSEGVERAGRTDQVGAMRAPDRLMQLLVLSRRS